MVAQGGKYDLMNQANKASTPAKKNEEGDIEYKCREIERIVNQLLEASAEASLIVRPALFSL